MKAAGKGKCFECLVELSARAFQLALSLQDRAHCAAPGGLRNAVFHDQTVANGVPKRDRVALPHPAG